MNRHATTAAALLAVALSACAPQAPLELNLRAVSVTVPRIPTPAVEIIEPAEAPPPVTLPRPTPVTSFLPPPPPPAPIILDDPFAGVEEPEDPCPAAPAFAVPTLTAGPYVDGLPVTETRTERATTAYAEPTADPTSASITSEVTTTVTRLEPVTSDAGQLIDAWVVERTDNVTGGSSVEQFRYVHPSDSPLAANPGIWLAGMAWRDDVRGELTFEPTGNGLWLLPEPVVLQAADGAQYVGSATDPATLTTLAIVRNVTGRNRVDACGELIDTYTVSVTGTLTAPGMARQVAWTLELATPYGGLDVSQTLALTSPADEATWTRTLITNTIPAVERAEDES